MADVATLEGKIQRIKKTLSERRQETSGAENSPELRAFRKQLKRLQRRRRDLLTWAQHMTKTQEGKDEKDTMPAPPAAVKTVEPG
jgi:predicted  nucleic acid-binding Zn-ribbon protein